MGEPATMDDDEFLPRADLGKYWPMLKGRLPETLAAAKRGPDYAIYGKTAWYRVGDVREWITAEKERQKAERAGPAPAPEPDRPRLGRPTKFEQAARRAAGAQA